MIRRIWNSVLAGAAVFGGLMLAESKTVATSEAAVPAGYQCRYRG